MKERMQGVMIGILLTIIVLGTISFAFQGSDYVERFYKDIKITLNGLLLEPKDVNGKDVEPFIIDGTTYLPVRAICEALDIKVNWIEERNIVELIDEKTSVIYRNDNGSNANDTDIVASRIQYGIEDDDTTKTDDKESFMRIGDKEYYLESNTSSSNTSSNSNIPSDTSVIIGGGKLNGTPTEMQKKALEDAREVLKNYYWGYSKENLKNYLSNRYVNSEVKYAIDNIDADWNEQAMKTASMLRNSCSTKESMRHMLEYFKYTEEEIEYAINHQGDFFKRNAAKYANTYDPDFEHISLEGGTITYYKMTFEEYMKKAGYEDEEIEFAKEELKYKQ